VLLDTSGLLCLHHKAEPFHREARVLYKQAHVRLTHSYVLAEFVALATAGREALARRSGSAAIIREKSSASALLPFKGGIDVDAS
jgi:hypothetical protein